MSRTTPSSVRYRRVISKVQGHEKILPGETPCAFNESTSKRRKGYPSETTVKRGVRIVHGDKELLEKLGRNDLCPCGSGRKFKRCHGGRN
jgi:uncharacterized protein YecA (UPF0149 family)